MSADLSARQAAFEARVRKRTSRRDTIVAKHMKNAHMRQLPDFIIIGTQRGGTTTLYHALALHPDIGSSVCKETHYYDRHPEMGLTWYRAHFPRQGKFPVVGEATPDYLRNPAVPALIANDLPAVKLIVLLRNPVDRAYSNYHMAHSKGLDERTFETAFEEFLQRQGSPAQEETAGPPRMYFERGLYAEQLRRWFAHFPREQFMILKSEDFYADMPGMLTQVFAFLGVADFQPGEIVERHRTKNPPMSPDTRDRLAAFYRPFNEELYALLDRDFGWEAASAARSALDQERTAAARDAAEQASDPGTCV